MADELIRVHAELLGRIQRFELDFLNLFLLVKAAEKPWRPSEVYPHFLREDHDLLMASSVSSVINQRVTTLEERGLGERRRDVPNDRRGVTFHLTDAGREMVKEFREFIVEILGDDKGQDFMDGLFS